MIIDSVLDYDYSTGVVSTTSADRLLKIITENDLIVAYILETHAHADHLSASRYIQNTLTQKQPDHRPQVGIGRRIGEVQKVMGDLYEVPRSETQDAFDLLFDDDATFSIGNLKAKVVHLPGHTPDHIGYVIGDNVFTGDSIFNPDVGSARCDFPNGSAEQLYSSTRKLLSFPDHFRLYTGHDYPPPDRLPGADGSKAVPFTAVRKQREENRHVNIDTKEEDFVLWRSERDGTLNDPKLLRIAIETNIRGGRLPSTTMVGDFPINQVPQGVVRV